MSEFSKVFAGSALLARSIYIREAAARIAAREISANKDMPPNHDKAAAWYEAKLWSERPAQSEEV